ncbi:MAG: sulfatase [Candidatus Aminicenantes bacterium]|jgi:arylsulfatase A-like enzyme
MKRILLLSVSLFFLFIVFLLVGSGCNSQPTYIFLVTLDTTRADYIDYSRSGNTLTPHLAELASRGQYFENAYALIPITLPSHASMFYSLPPHRLTIYNNGQIQTVSWPSVTQLLKGNGFATGAVISLGVLKAEFGLDKGFDRYIENFQPYLWTKHADEVNQEVFRLIPQTIREKPGKKYFFWIHYSDPHEPYFPPEKTGTFKIMVNNLEVFRSPSTEQPAVNIEFTLVPGKNSIVFDTEVPVNFNAYAGGPVQVRYIKYQDFSLESRDKKDKKTVIKTTVPGEWNTKKTRTGTNYYANEKKSGIAVLNPTREPITVNLRFIYRLWVDDASRKRLYKEEIKFMDRQLGKFLDFLRKENLYDNAVFIIMGDHGEGLGEYRGHFGHIHFLNRPAVKVPLIIAGKGIKSRGKRQELVSNLNIAPTLLDIAGMEKPDFMLGHSLLKSLPQTKLLLETYAPEAYFDAFSIIDYPYQVIFYPGRRDEKLEFFVLESHQPGRNKNQQGKMRAELVNSVLKISRIITATKGKIGAVSERHQEILKSLGYL